MNVSELYELTHWVTDKIVSTQIPQKYQALQQILQQHTQPNQQKTSFESQKNDLIETITHVPLRELTKDQLLFLRELGIAQAVGSEGAEIIEDILYKNVIDVANSAQKLQEIYQKISQGIQKSDQIKTGLTGCVYEETYEAEDEVLMRVSFTGNAALSNVIDFKNWGNIWFEIGRGVAMAHDLSPEDVKIVGATKGSIIIELAVIASIATTTSGIILSALKVAEKVLDIRKKAEEIRGLKLKNKKLATDIEKEAEKEKTAGIESISAEIIKQLKIKKDGEGDKVTALDKAVKNLVNFIESGGEVDFIIPEEQNEIPKYGDLRVTFQEIRQLENKIKLLEKQ
ncbi:hypothetical protein ACOHYD_13350 [Desulfobacterota bacterium M19]